MTLPTDLTLVTSTPSVFAVLVAPLQAMFVPPTKINSLAGMSGGLTFTVPRVFPTSRASCLLVFRHLRPRAVTV